MEPANALASAFRWLAVAPLGQAVAAILAENVAIFLGAIAFGGWLKRRYAHRPVALPPDALAGGEVAVAAGTVALNTLTTLVGMVLWRRGIIRFRTDVGLRAWFDVVVLLIVMDLLMYGLHRFAHHPRIFPWLHRLHHGFDRPRPLTLFVLHPLENIAFGLLWLAVITAYPASWLGMSVYLALNVLFGTIGHLGVEPFPTWWATTPGLRLIAGSTFHARHHQDLGCNFGFYTLIWDRLFGTLGADYASSFGRVPAWARDCGSTARARLR